MTKGLIGRLLGEGEILAKTAPEELTAAPLKVWTRRKVYGILFYEVFEIEEIKPRGMSLF